MRAARRVREGARGKRPVATPAPRPRAYLTTALREAKSAIRGAGPSTGPMFRSGSPDLIRQEHAAWVTAVELTRADRPRRRRGRLPGRQGPPRRRSPRIPARFPSPPHGAPRSPPSGTEPPPPACRAESARATALGRHRQAPRHRRPRPAPRPRNQGPRRLPPRPPRHHHPHRHRPDQRLRLPRRLTRPDPQGPAPALAATAGRGPGRPPGTTAGLPARTRGDITLRRTSRQTHQHAPEARTPSSTWHWCSSPRPNGTNNGSADMLLAIYRNPGKDAAVT